MFEVGGERLRRYGIIAIATVILVLLATACTDAPAITGRPGTQPSASAIKIYASSDQIPPYKLQENIRQQFRPEWIWNESKQDYDNLGDLKRDPKTGLFPEPSPATEELKQKAYWDPYLALYIRKSVQIDHETGKVSDNIFANAAPEGNQIQKPEYSYSPTDPYDAKYSEFMYRRYQHMDKTSSHYVSVEDVIKLENLTPEWFNIKTSDLPMILGKLEKGADSEYLMALIRLITKCDARFIFHNDTYISLKILRDALNKLTSEASERVTSGNIKELGYLALPLIYDELKNGKGDNLLPQLPDVANGQKGLDKATATQWDKAKWIKWFEDNKADMDSLRFVLEHPIKMPWLDNVKTGS